MSAPHSGGMWDGVPPDTFPPTHEKPSETVEPDTDAPQDMEGDIP
jgi:hypothetical protein